MAARPGDNSHPNPTAHFAGVGEAEPVSRRVSGRHRAPRPCHTPLTPLAAAVGDRVTQLNRTGLAVAVSSGLLATGGIPLPPAQAATVAAPAPETSWPATAWTSSPAENALVSGATLRAPEAAAPDFDDPAFTAVPRPAPVPAPAPPPATPATPARPALAPRPARPTAPAPQVRPVSRPTRPTRSAPAPRRTSRATRPAPALAPSIGGARSGLLAIAARYLGVPYVWGGTTPRGFDCSGYVQYVYAQAGIRLPRTADQQMHAGRQIPRSQARPGDLVAFVSGGEAHHIAIYAGGNAIYDAPHAGSSVNRRPIWSAAVVFVRV